MQNDLYIYFPFQPEVDQELETRRFYVGSIEEWAKEMVLGGSAPGLTDDNSHSQLISIRYEYYTNPGKYAYTLESGPYKRELLERRELARAIGSALGTHAADETWDLVVRSWFS